jgi:hypothetical protein
MRKPANSALLDLLRCATEATFFCHPANFRGDDMTKLPRLLLALALLSLAPATSEAAPFAFLTFGVTTTSLVEQTTTFAFLFGTPIAPDFYTEATIVGEVTVTPGAQGAATVEPSGIYPTYLSGSGSLGLVETNLGVDLGTAPCTATVAPVTCSFTLITNTFGPTFYDNLEALLTYDQTGLGSKVSWSATVTLSETVPEPSLVALLALGTLSGIRRFRRSRA